MKKFTMKFVVEDDVDIDRLALDIDYALLDYPGYEASFVKEITDEA